MWRGGVEGEGGISVEGRCRGGGWYKWRGGVEGEGGISVEEV